MTRYKKVKQILDLLPIENRKICQSKGACCCRGCVSVHGIKEHELKLYLEGKLK